MFARSAFRCFPVSVIALVTHRYDMRAHNHTMSLTCHEVGVVWHFHFYTSGLNINTGWMYHRLLHRILSRHGLDVLTWHRLGMILTWHLLWWILTIHLLLGIHSWLSHTHRLLGVGLCRVLIRVSLRWMLLRILLRRILTWLPWVWLLHLTRRVSRHWLLTVGRLSLVVWWLSVHFLNFC